MLGNGTEFETQRAASLDLMGLSLTKAHKHCFFQQETEMETLENFAESMMLKMMEMN